MGWRSKFVFRLDVIDEFVARSWPPKKLKSVDCVSDAAVVAHAYVAAATGAGLSRGDVSHPAVGVLLFVLC